MIKRLGTDPETKRAHSTFDTQCPVDPGGDRIFCRGSYFLSVRVFCRARLCMPCRRDCPSVPRSSAPARDASFRPTRQGYAPRFASRPAS